MNDLLRLRSRALIDAASRTTDTRQLPAPTVQALERIARQNGPLLALPPEIEHDFRREWRIAVNPVRLLCLLPTAVFLLLPWGAQELLAIPGDLVPLVRWVSFGIIAPACVAAAAATWSFPQHSVPGTAILLAGVVTVGAIEWVRALCAREGYAVDHTLALCVPVGLSVLGGFRFRRVVGVLGAYILIALTTEHLGGLPLRTPTGWLGEAILLLMAALAALWMETTQRRSWAARQLLQLQAHQDPLTGLRNRRSFELHFELVAAQARREQRRLFFALADLDYFKRVNDRYGHDYGDGALSEVAVVLNQFARRPLDAVARLGGEEFAILLYDCNQDQAQIRLQELIDQVGALEIDNEDAPLRVLTISAGGVVSDGSLPMSELYHSADQYLYAVKHRGRNGARVGPVLTG